MFDYNNVQQAILGILLIATALCYMPIFLWEKSENVSDTLDQDDYYLMQGTICSVIIATPVFIDSLIETGLMHEDIISRWCIILSLAVPNLVNYVYGNGLFFSLPIAICSYYSRQILIAAACLYSCTSMHWQVKIIFGIAYSYLCVAYSVIPFVEVRNLLPIYIFNICHLSRIELS